MPTDLLFRDDAYATRCDATVVAVDEAGGIVLDRTVFYATGGGQPGDSGMLETPAGPVAITSAVYAADKATVLHLTAPGGPRPAVGDRVVARIDWEPRLARMRIHTALHLLTTVLPYPVTGGAIGDGEGRLDFDIPDAGLDRDAIAADLAARIARNAAVRERWITDDELLAQPELVKTMSVKPPMGSGRVRLVEIVDLDLQPCGGTHVRNTAEIGTVAVTNIEKKGKQNRRVRIALV